MTKQQKEYKIAYNFLFTDAHINDCTLDTILKNIDTHDKVKSLKLNMNNIKAIVINNYTRYKAKPFIASSYDEIVYQLKISDIEKIYAIDTLGTYNVAIVRYAGCSPMWVKYQNDPRIMDYLSTHNDYEVNTNNKIEYYLD